MDDPTRLENLISRLRDGQAQGMLVGASPLFLEAVSRLGPIAKSDATVLISGETGTGKELVARAIHYMSARAAFPFLAVNCGALPDTLLEDELFGHVRGAFTSAYIRRAGLIAQAEKGSLFLDEVDTLSAKAQVSLLRVLQDKRFRPVGSSAEQRADIRVLAATNVSLDSLVQSGAFRADLFYRLCVFSIQLPPLRDRIDDIPLLACHFLRKHTPEGRIAPALNAEASAALLAYSWPGNVRELENAIIRAIHVGAGSEPLQIDDLGIPGGRRPTEQGERGARLERSHKELKREAVEAFERAYLAQLMRDHGGNVTRAARAAKKERRDFGRLLKKYGISPGAYRTLS